MNDLSKLSARDYAKFGEGKFDVVGRSKLSRILQDAGKSILDVGCGPGSYIYELSKLGYVVSGVDRNELFVEQARQLGGDVYQIELETDQLEHFADNSFDTVLLLDVLEHITCERDLLNDAIRVCRKNVIVTVPAVIPKSLEQSGFVFASYLDPTHIRYYSETNLRNLFDSCNLRELKIASVFRFDPILYQVVPEYMRPVVRFLNRVILKLSDPNQFTVVWYAVGCKA